PWCCAFAPTASRGRTAATWMRCWRCRRCANGSRPRSASPSPSRRSTCTGEVVKVYAVGGAVRDELLGLPVKDRDYVVVGATPEEMERLGYKPVGKDFPVFLHPRRTRNMRSRAPSERAAAATRDSRCTRRPT